MKSLNLPPVFLQCKTVLWCISHRFEDFTMANHAETGLVFRTTIAFDKISDKAIRDEMKKTGLKYATVVRLWVREKAQAKKSEGK